MAVYDLFAVLTPMGPLQLLLKVLQRNNQPLTALVYEARPANMANYAQTRLIRANREQERGSGGGEPGEEAAAGPGSGTAVPGEAAGHSSREGPRHLAPLRPPRALDSARAGWTDAEVSRRSSAASCFPRFA